MLHDAAKLIVREYDGVVPVDPVILMRLPGVGPYTARAVAAFATNADVVFVETNLRTVVLHHFFPDRKLVREEEVLAVLAKTFPKGRARAWYAALMDYGAYLKRSGVKLNAKSEKYTKQTAFAGSARQARGAILKELAKGGAPLARLLGLLGDARAEQMQAQLTKLHAEGMLQKKGMKYVLPG